eukprot:Mycagemm_TRINITY_DN10370_c2_g10::TRINITY_DN10370_c2_g10_i3::g.1126::m.1126 type:complete len:100 gc:universal TRINITY_DN10370_c2_g10_i3:555-854(+)
MKFPIRCSNRSTHSGHETTYRPCNGRRHGGRVRKARSCIPGIVHATSVHCHLHTLVPPGRREASCPRTCSSRPSAAPVRWRSSMTRCCRSPTRLDIVLG